MQFSLSHYQHFFILTHHKVLNLLVKLKTFYFPNIMH